MHCSKIGNYLVHMLALLLHSIPTQIGTNNRLRARMYVDCVVHKLCIEYSDLKIYSVHVPILLL